MTELLRSKPFPLRTFQIRRVVNGRMLATVLVRGTDTKTALHNFMMVIQGHPEPIVSGLRGEEYEGSSCVLGAGDAELVCEPFEEKL